MNDERHYLLKQPWADKVRYCILNAYERGEEHRSYNEAHNRILLCLDKWNREVKLLWDKLTLCIEHNFHVPYIDMDSLESLRMEYKSNWKNIVLVLMAKREYKKYMKVMNFVLYGGVYNLPLRPSITMTSFADYMWQLSSGKNVVVTVEWISAMVDYILDFSKKLDTIEKRCTEELRIYTARSYWWNHPC